MGVYKSADALQSVGALRPATGFPAWPASAIGRQVAVGAPTMSQKTNILFGACVTNPDNVAEWRQGEVDFNKYTFVNQFGGNDLIVTRALTSTLWFLCTFSQRHGSIGYESAICMRTKDGGTTWAVLADPATNDKWQDIVMAAGGRLWGLTTQVQDNVNGRSKIWYSDDEGDSWTLSHTEDGGAGNYRTYFLLAAHPTDADRIVVIGDRGTISDTILTLITDDGGDSWTSNLVVAWDASNGHWMRVIILPSNRLVLGGAVARSPAEDAVLTSDDDGVSWDVAQRFAITGMTIGPVANAAGTRIYLLVQINSGSPFESQIWESKDQGTTWADLSNDVPHAAEAIYRYNGGIAYNEQEDALYALGQGGRTVNTLLVMRLSPVASGSGWQDFSDQAVPIGGYTSFNVDIISNYALSIATIPS